MEDEMEEYQLIVHRMRIRKEIIIIGILKLYSLDHVSRSGRN
jgi:hypothetical protein